MPSDVEFLVYSGIFWCGWNIYSNVFIMATPSFALRHNTAILASAAYEITLRIMVDTT